MRISSAIRTALFALVAIVSSSPASHADSGFVTLTNYKAGWFIGGFGGGTCQTGMCAAGTAAACATNADCTAPQTCQMAGGVGGAMTCQLPPCTAPNTCGAGNVCCSGGGGRCRVAAGGGGCPMGTGGLVCATNADCTAPQTCNPGPVMGSLRRCGAPPAMMDAGPPPVDAGAGG